MQAELAEAMHEMQASRRHHAEQEGRQHKDDPEPGASFFPALVADCGFGFHSLSYS